MVKQWIVKSGRHKATYFRKDALGDYSEQNVLGLVKNGESVIGDFLLIRRASREAGFVKVRHLEKQPGSTWLVRNADGAPSTLLRKHPQEVHDPSNTVGYAMEGEMVEGEYLFCVRAGERRGGFVKVRHLKPAKEPKLPVAAAQDPAEVAALAAGLRSKPMQRWVIMDSSHDGAWMRKEPSVDRSPKNILCLVPNGTVVVGEFLHVHRPSTGESGFLQIFDVEQRGPKHWSPKRNDVALLMRPSTAEDSNVVSKLVAGERLEGEYIHVSHKSGKHEGFIKRQYLTALAHAQG